MEDLSYTYYTVEQISKRLKKQKIQSSSEINSELVNEFYEEMKQDFSAIVDEVKTIINDQDYEIDYPLQSGMMYCKFKVNNLLSGDDEDRIKNLINDNYHIEIEILNNSSEINIHKKIFNV